MTNFVPAILVQRTSRRGITLIELLVVIGMLYSALWIINQATFRVREIAETITGERQNIVGVVFFLILLFLICIAVCINRFNVWFRIRYGNLLYFPLLVGLPLGFAIVPFRPFPLHVYALLLATAVIVSPLVFFFIQSIFLLYFQVSVKPKRSPIPEILPPYSPDFIPIRSKPIASIKDVSPHPNATLAWLNFHNSVGIHCDYAIEAYRTRSRYF